MQFDEGLGQRQAEAGPFIFAVEVAVDLLEGVGIRNRGISPNFGLESQRRITLFRGHTAKFYPVSSEGGAMACAGETSVVSTTNRRLKRKQGRKSDGELGSEIRADRGGR